MLVREEHDAELACHELEALVVERQLSAVGLLKHDRFRIARFLLCDFEHRLIEIRGDDLA